MTTIVAPDKSERSRGRRKKAIAIEEGIFTVILETAVYYRAFILEGLQFRESQKPYKSLLIMSVNSMAVKSNHCIFYITIGVTE